MKRTLSMIALAALTMGLLGSCSKINERLDNLEKEVSGIENEQIASINSQIDGITSSISDLGQIRSDISSLKQSASDHNVDIFNLEEADRALADRILNLEAVLPNYAEKEWVEATFSTLEQYEATCDTIAKIDARIGALDAKLAKDIKATADSLTKWVNKQFEGYYTAAQMDAKLTEMKSAIDSSKASGKISDAKADSIAAELTVLAGAVDTAKANIRLEYRSAIDTAIKTSEGKLTKKITDAIKTVNGKIESLAIRVGSLETKVNDLIGRVKKLEGMIQSVTIVPAYKDGSLEKVEGGIITIDCIISPASAVQNLKKENFNVWVNTVKTKAETLVPVKVSDIKIEENGIVSIYAQAPAAPAPDSSHTVAVRIKDEYSDYTTEFHKFGYSDKNVKVVDLGEPGKEYKKVYIAPSDASKPKDVAGIIPVQIDGKPTFDGSKSTVIEAVGMGIVTFDKDATKKIAENATGADNIFFEVKDVTEPSGKQEVVYQVLMKKGTAGVEVFSKDNAAGEVTMEIPLDSNVGDVKEVTLNEEGKPIDGGVVYGSIVYDNQNNIVTFKVKCFSKSVDISYVPSSEYNPVSGISLDKTSAKLKVGGTLTLKATITPEDATNKNVFWSSSDTSKVKVDTAGKVTAVALGTATVTATTMNLGKTATCTVTVNSPVSDMKYSKAVYSEEGVPHWEFTMRETDGDSGYPVLIVKAGPAYSGEFIEGDFKILSAVLQTSASESTKYKDNAGTVAITCTESGTSDKAGKYNYVVNARDASGNDIELTTTGLSTSAKNVGGEAVTLKDKSASDPTRKAVTGVSFPSDYKPEITYGISIPMASVLNVTPTDATNPYAQWTSSDETVATVDAYGNVKGVGSGEATITATSVDGKKTATCTVAVTKSPVFDMKYSKAVYSEEGGAHWEFTMRETAGDIGYPVLIVKAGPAYSGEFIEGDFNILSAVLKTNASESTQYKDNVGTVTITCTESGTASKAGKYSFDVKAKDASNKDVELVTNPLTTSVKDAAGKAVTLKDKSASDTDRKEVKEISFPSGYKPAVAAGTSTQLHFDVNPTDATNPNAYWKSSDESVATVDATGKVTGVGEGSATITATSVDGKKTATCTVSVKSPFEVLNSAVATYKEDENGAYWEFDISKSDGEGGYPKFIVKAGPAYSGEFIEGDFQILSAVMQTSASKSTKYKDNVGSVTITCTGSGTGANEYKYEIKAKDASGKDVNQTLSGVKTTARDKDGKAKTLRDKSASDPVRKAVTGISFPSNYNPKVAAGSSTQLSFNVTPSDATNPNAYWKSSDESVAIVDATGNVRGLKEGTATITATSVDGRKTATCTVTVNTSSISDMKYAKAVYSEEGGAHWEFTMCKTDGEGGYPKFIVKAGPAYSGEFIEGDFKILSAVMQTSASESTKYKDNVGSVTVTCTESGTASAAGKYIFDVKAKDASNKNVELITNPLTTSAKAIVGGDITLKDKDASDPDYKAVTGISFPNGYAPEVFAKSSTQLSFTVNPSDATNPYAYWTSSDETVATVDAYGKVKGVDEGTATITATSVDGKKTTTCTVTVKPSVKAVYSEEGGAHWEFTIHRADGNDGYPELVVKAGPAYSGDFIEGDFNIISAVLKTSASESTDYKANAGTVTITCTKSGTAGKAGKYNFDINAKDASDGDVKFTESGLPTRAETTGGVAITLKDKDPLDPDYRAVTSIKISKYESEASVGSSTQMSFTVNPSNATNPYVYWTSSDPTVATVDAYGKVKGLKEGTTIITATSVNGKKTATCTFNVRRGTEQYDHNDNPYWF